MPRFRYTALDAAGKLTSGIAEAHSADQARQRLAAQGLQVQSLELLPDENAGGTGERTASSGSRLSSEQRAELSGYLASLVGAGVPLGPALRTLAEELGKDRLAKALRRLAERVDRGQSLDEALRAIDRRSALLLQGILIAGGRKGRLAELLNELVSAEADERHLRWRAWLGLLYPTLVLLGAVLLFSAAIATSIRGMGEIYAEFELDLPEVRRLASFWP